MGTLLASSFGELNSEGEVVEIYTNDILNVSRDKDVQKREAKLAQWTLDRFSEADILIGHNSLAFDRWFLNGVLFRQNLGSIPRRIHIDTYQTAKGRLGMGASMKNLVDIMREGSKDAPSKHDWRDANIGDPAAVARIVERCESDILLTARMWARLKSTYMERFGR